MQDLNKTPDFEPHKPKTGSIGKAKKAVSKKATKTRKKVEKAASAVNRQAETLAEDALDTARTHAVGAAEYGIGQTEDVVRSIGRAFEAGSRSLEADGMAGTAGYARAAANGLMQAAEEVDGVNTSGIADRVENFIRDRPMLTIGALALAGFAFTSSLKSRRDKS